MRQLTPDPPPVLRIQVSKASVARLARGETVRWDTLPFMVIELVPLDDAGVPVVVPPVPLVASAKKEETK